MIAKYCVGSSSLFNLILACGCVQITHDVHFNYLVVQPVPRGTNEILDLFKDFVVQNTWKIVLTDFIMITGSVGGAYLLSRQSTVATPIVYLGSGGINILTRYRGSGASGFIVENTGSQADLTSGSTITANITLKIIGRYEANNFAVSTNANTVATDVSGTVPTVSALYIGSDNGVNYLNGWLAKIFYFPQALIDAELQAFSK
jgi:hypothetical protein